MSMCDRFMKWKEKKTKIVVGYSESKDSILKHAIGHIAEYDNIFIFVRDDKWDKEICLPLKLIRYIKVFKERKNGN